jgi:zinc protease
MTRPIALLTALLALLLPGLAMAADPLVPTDTTLANGLHIRVIEDHNLPLAAVVLMIPAGAAHDPAGLQGTATMTARLLSEGTRDRSALELAEAIEDLGADLEVDAGTAFTTVGSSFLARDLPEGLALLAEVVDRPLLAAEDLERERERAQASLAENLVYAPFVASRVVYAELYPDHPFGWAEGGTEASLAAIAVEDVQAFHKARYRPRGSVLCIVGDVNTREIVRQAEHAFRGWRGAAEAMDLGPLPEPWQGVRKVLVHMPEQTQIQVRIARRTVARTHPDHTALRQANAVVGGGFTSRLMEEIRVERSLSYGASSSLWSFDTDAVFQARTFTANETAREALEVAWQVITEWRAGGWPEEEFERARNYTLGMVPQALETRLSRAWTLAMMSYHGLPADDMAQRAAQVLGIERGTAEAAVSRHLDDDGWLVVVVGDLVQVREQLEDFDGGGWDVIEVE